MSQETRYGGREACDTKVLSNQANINHAAVTFHPFANSSMGNFSSQTFRNKDQQPPEEEEASASGYLPSLQWLRRKRREHARETRQRSGQGAGGASGSSSVPPGLLPWKTFYTGSMVLILVWFTGFCWCVRQLVFRYDGPVVPERPRVLEFYHGGLGEIPGVDAGGVRNLSGRKVLFGSIEGLEGLTGDGIHEVFEHKHAQAHTTTESGTSTEGVHEAGFRNFFSKAGHIPEFSTPGDTGLNKLLASISESKSTPETSYRLFEAEPIQATTLKPSRPGFFKPTGLACGSENSTSDVSCYISERYKIHKLDWVSGSRGELTASCPSRTALTGVVGGPIAVTGVSTEETAASPALFDGSELLSLDAEDAELSCQGNWRDMFLDENADDSWLGMRHIAAKAATSGSAAAVSLVALGADGLITGFSSSKKAKHAPFLPSFEVRDVREYRDLALYSAGDLNLLFALREDNSNIVDLGWELSGSTEIKSLAWVLPGAPDQEKGWTGISACGKVGDAVNTRGDVRSVTVCAVSGVELVRFGLNVPTDDFLPKAEEPEEPAVEIEL